MAILATITGTYDPATGIHILDDGTVCKYDSIAGNFITADGPPIADEFRINQRNLTPQEKAGLARFRRLAQAMGDLVDASSINPDTASTIKDKIREAIFWAVHGIGA